MSDNVTQDYPEPDPIADDLDERLEGATEEPGPEEKTDSKKEAPAEKSAETTPAEEKKADETGIRKALTDTQRAYHKSQMELAALKARIDERDRMNSEKPADEKDWLEDYSDDQLRLTPEVTKEMIKKHRQEIVGLLQARDEYWKQEMANRDPDVVSARDRIQELRSDPDYAQFTDKQLAVIIRKTSKPEEVTREPVRTSGVPGGRGAPSRGSSNDDIRKSSLYKQIYGEGEQS